MRVVVLDDDQNAAQQFLENLTKSAKKADIRVEGTRGVVQDFLEELRNRQALARKGKTSSMKISLDEADLVVVDYDLGETKGAMGLTGEEFSYLARCFSTCGAIVALNQFPTGVFDLTLVSRGDTWADLNVDDGQLSNPGLWTWQGTGFRPWSWPRLGLLPEQVRWLMKRLEKAIESGESMGAILEIPESAAEALLPGHLDRLGLLESPVADFARGQLNRKDQAIKAPAILARAAASRLRNTIEHVLAPGQDLLCDLPHLAQKYPSLAKNAKTHAEWNKLLETADQSVKALAPTAFALNKGMSRNYWWLPEIKGRKLLPEDKEPWNYKPPGIHFLEDTSAFVPADKSRKFSPGALGSMQISYIGKGSPGITYLPVSRLLE